jgi:hypothetical protein
MPDPSLRRLGILVLLALTASPSPARAQDDLPPAPYGAATMRRGLETPAGYWEGAGPSRSFASAIFDAGLFYYGAQLSLGWGKPHWRWGGIDAGGQMGRAGATVYGGLHAVLDHFEARVGARYVTPIERHFLPVQEAYVPFDLETVRTARAHYVLSEIELKTSFHLLGGSLLALLDGYALFGVPADHYVFEETLRVVAAPPGLWRGRLAYLAHLGPSGELHLGAAGELIGVPERGTLVARAGPVLRVGLTEHLEAAAALLVVVASPDAIGLIGADLGLLGFRYRWATGDPHPAFP